ncbi:MAG: RluA family pseudouridine synthase [Kiritimatiellia bacterium]
MKRAQKGQMRGIRILHEDPDVIVIEKAAGILSQDTRRGDVYSVEGALTDYVRKGQWKSSKRVYLVHRLDRETSGVMMVAKTERAQEWLRENWNEVTTKIYLARVEGAMGATSGVFESYLREDENYFVKSVANPKYGKLARTEWRVAEGRSMPGTTLVEVTLKSGRKNQIRVHFSEAGHPVVGDAKYGHGRRGAALCLHAWKLAFRHPHTGETLRFETEPPVFAGNMVK